MRKRKALDVMEVCILRRDCTLSCSGCKYKGKECIEAHKYARNAIFCISEREVKNDDPDD